ncbi:uncharacterized protein LOC130689925 [Daphnia carinata]|uniref:uncharacterized protein LOC130689925 n=1 Tax=Daphnia carinata TaxID=120202 RepID=UPI00257E918E|nr:uncharacterized protein LOC130689925 [Daphnia carinata]
MNELAEVAREAFLLPIQIINDRSFFEEGFQCQWATKVDSAVSDLKNRLPNCSFPSKDELIEKGKDVLQLLILCGEHNVCAEWNTQKLVENVKDLLELLLFKLDAGNICDILCCKGVAHTVLQQLKPKLGKNQIKAYPAAVNCFLWVITNTKLPAIDESVDFAIPVSLVLFDDWEPTYQQKGLDCISHILNQNPKSLQKRGWLEVIFSSLKKNTQFSDRLNLYKCLDICLKLQTLDLEGPSHWNRDEEYDSLVNDLLQSTLVQDSPSAATCNLKILVILFHSMKIKMAKFLPSVIAVLDNYLAVGVTLDIHVLTVELMELTIEYCWVCLEPQFTSHLSWLLFKLASEKLADEETRQRISKCADLVENISPSPLPILSFRP